MYHIRSAGTSRLALIDPRALPVLLTIFLLTGCVSTPPEEVSLKLSWRHGVQFPGYYAADGQGFYADENLRVPIAPLEDPSENAAAPHRGAAGDYDCGTAARPLVLAQARGVPVTAIALIGRLSPLAFFARANSVQQSYARLENLVADRTAELQAANEQLQQEVVDRKQIEAALQVQAEALRHNDERFRSLVENAQDIITVLNRAGTVRYQSPSIRRILGYQAEELVGQNFVDLFRPEDVPFIQQTLPDTNQIATPIHPIAARMRHKNGAWCLLELISTNLLSDPAVAGLVINSRDITERQQFENQLRQSQKMAAIGQLAGGVAHDFNHILTAILSYSDIRLMLHPDEHGRGHEGAVQIQKAADRAASSTNPLLAFSRKQILRPTVLNLNSIITHASEMLRRLMGADVVRDLTYEILTQSGYKVLTAKYGGEALKVGEGYGEDIHRLLTDVVMPNGMNGPQLAQRVTALRPETHVLFMSGYASDVIGQDGVLDSGTNFIQKPFTGPAMIAKVRAALDGV